MNSRRRNCRSRAREQNTDLESITCSVSDPERTGTIIINSHHGLLRRSVCVTDSLLHHVSLAPIQGDVARVCREPHITNRTRGCVSYRTVVAAHEAIQRALQCGETVAVWSFALRVSPTLTPDMWHRHRIAKRDVSRICEKINPSYMWEHLVLYQPFCFHAHSIYNTTHGPTSYDPVARSTRHAEIVHALHARPSRRRRTTGTATAASASGAKHSDMDTVDLSSCTTSIRISFPDMFSFSHVDRRLVVNALRTLYRHEPNQDSNQPTSLTAPKLYNPPVPVHAISRQLFQTCVSQVPARVPSHVTGVTYDTLFHWARGEPIRPVAYVDSSEDHLVFVPVEYVKHSDRSRIRLQRVVPSDTLESLRALESTSPMYAPVQINVRGNPDSWYTLVEESIVVFAASPE